MDEKQLELLKEMAADKYIFGALFMIANKMDTLLERELKEFGITTKQWYLSIIVGSLFEKPPTLKEVGKAMGSSHQNVKQVALKLQEKNLLQLVKDKKDGRVTRLQMTKESEEFWKQTDPKGNRFTAALFDRISNEDMKTAAFVLQRIMENLSMMENESNKGEGEDEE